MRISHPSRSGRARAALGPCGRAVRLRGHVWGAYRRDVAAGA